MNLGATRLSTDVRSIVPIDYRDTSSRRGPEATIFASISHSPDFAGDVLTFVCVLNSKFVCV